MTPTTDLNQANSNKIQLSKVSDASGTISAALEIGTRDDLIKLIDKTINDKKLAAIRDAGIPAPTYADENDWLTFKNNLLDGNDPGQIHLIYASMRQAARTDDIQNTFLYLGQLGKAVRKLLPHMEDGL